jgi:hypothetical protein
MKRLAATLAVLWVLASAILPVPVLAAGDIYYVRTDGNDGNAGTTDNTSGAWRTIDHAVDTAGPGSLIYVHAGTYGEWVTIESGGTEGNVKTLRNYPGETVIVDGAGVSDPGYRIGLLNVTAGYLWVEGIELCNLGTPDGVGVMLWGASGVTLKDLKIHNMSAGAIWAGSTISDLVIDRCECYANFQTSTGDENITLTATVNGFEVKNCHIHDNLAKEGIDCKDGCTNGSIHDNRIFDANVGVYIGGNGADPQSGIEVYNNWIEDCGDAIEINNETGTGAITDIGIFNNVVVNCEKGFLAAVQGPAYTATYRLVNNTFYNMSVLGIGDSGNHYTRTGCVWRNNIVVVSDAGAYVARYHDYRAGGIEIEHNLYYSLSRSYNTVHTYGTGYIIDQDPLFFGSGDYRLAPASPARDAGSVTSAPATDFLGNSRDQADRVDIGAYVYIAPQQIATAPPPEVATPGVSGRLVSGIVVALLVVIFLMRALAAYLSGEDSRITSR